MHLPKVLALAAIAFAFGVTLSALIRGGTGESPLLSPDAAAANQSAPKHFKVKIDTSQGPMTMDIIRDWAPHGVDRFYNLARAGYFDGSKFYRVIAGKWAQFGINGDPKVSTAWRDKNIPDDPPGKSNVRGTIAFAFAVPNGRSTQLFINLRDNSATHDAEPFVPIGRITSGMEVADSLYAGFGETSGGGIRAGHQQRLFEEGNPYLDKNFPKLDFIKRVQVMPP